MHVAGRIFGSGTIWLGMVCLTIFFISYMVVLTWADFSFVQPVSAVGFAVVALLSRLLLKETISPTRWTGVALICLGVFLVSQTPPRTTETP